MATEPEDRYATCRALADDIERWLADEPVVRLPGKPPSSARPLAPPSSNLDLRRRAAACWGSPSPRPSAWSLWTAAGAARRQARDQAETNYNLAKKAVEDYFTRVSEDTLLKEQDSVDIRRLRGELLKTALAYYREFLRQRGGDPELRRELAEAQFRVGQIMRELGTADEAIAAFDASIAIWEELRAAVARRPGRARPTGAVLPGPGRAVSPGSAISPGLRRPGAVARHPQEACGREARRCRPTGSQPGRMRQGAGHRRGRGGEPDADWSGWSRPSRFSGRWSRSPGDPAYRKRLADTINAQGVIYFKNGNDAEALRAFREFQEICQSLLEDQRSGRKPAQLLNSLALSYYNVGAILYKRDHHKALEIYEKSLEYRRSLVEAHPSVSDFHENLATEPHRDRSAPPRSRPAR